MPYTIKLLDDSEFNKLPFKYVKESLGCADADKGIAYIRQTGVTDIDMGTIEHEVEELVSLVSPHEEDGIRYKKMGKPFKAIFGNEEERAAQQGTLFGNLFGGGGGGGTLGALGSLALAPITGGASLGLMAPMATAGGAIQGGMQGKGLGSALLGALKGYGAGNVVSGGAGLVKGATTGTGVLKGGMEGLTNYGINPMISKALGSLTGTAPASTTSTLAPTSTVANVYPFPGQAAIPVRAYQTASPLTNLFGVMSSAKSNVGLPANTKSAIIKNPAAKEVITAEPYTAPVVQQAVQQGAQQAGQAGLGNIAGNVAQTAIGAALSGASAVPGNAQFPEIPSLDQLRSEIATKGASPALYVRTKRTLEDSYKTARERLDAVYNNANMLDSGEYRDEVRELEKNKADADELLAAQIDEQTMNDLLGLTNMDINLAALKYGADAQDIKQLREILGTSGGLAIASGTGNLGSALSRLWTA